MQMQQTQYFKWTEKKLQRSLKRQVVNEVAMIKPLRIEIEGKWSFYKRLVWDASKSSHLKLL